MSGVDYSGYLKLSQILNSQEPESVKAGRPAHDEMLFIIIHQAYELWFKQILFEVDSVLEIFSEKSIPEWKMGVAVSRLQRVTEILKLLNDQVKILETMTPLDFLDFRDLVTPASGFQSLQFRLLENKLGLELQQRMTYQDQAYHSRLEGGEKSKALESEKQPSLLRLLEAWLQRIPFMENDQFSFIKSYHKAVKEMLERDRQSVLKNPGFTDEAKKKELEKIALVERSSDIFLDEKAYSEFVKSGTKKLSHRAMVAALFINVYRDMPVLHLPFKLLTLTMDIDELLTTWRYKHALMVHRMIGNKIGTGGSSGFDYLRMTVEKHKIFTDLFDLSTLFIPRSQVPKLPEDLIKKLDFA